MPPRKKATSDLPGKVALWDFPDLVVFPAACDTLEISASYFHEERALPSPDAPYVLISLSRKEKTGTVCRLLRIEQGEGGGYSIFLQGIARASFRASRSGGRYFAEVTPLAEKRMRGPGNVVRAKMRSIVQRLQELALSSGRPTQEFIADIGEVQDPGRFADLLAHELGMDVPEAAKVLSEPDPAKRLDLVQDHVSREIQIETLRVEIDNKAYAEIDKRQREYFLKQQMDTIQSELYPEKDLEGSAQYYRKIAETLPAPPEAKEYILKEVTRLSRLSSYSEESSQIKPYLDLVLDLPWGREERSELNISRVKALLEKGHYGLQKAKKRIVEHLAVAKIGGREKGKIFCFAGPPGVGKTSLAKAVASALGRGFVQMSLGGIKDESEIRGHRKTYIGAMPGRIIQGIRLAKTMNPVFLLDEIDKIGSDFRGDPTAALLEALDPVQNRHFVDNYLGFPFDLSRVLFITTANTLDSVHPAFVDRLEVLELPSYSEEEKLAIAGRHIVVKVAEETNVGDRIELTDDCLLAIIREYTREAGVRNLEREIERVFRHYALKIAGGRKFPGRVDGDAARKILGAPSFFDPMAVKRDRVGVATGLAYTEHGGELIFTEVLMTEGSGNLTLTGQLGEVMKESAQAALTFVKAALRDLRLDPKALSAKDVHIHFPEGAVPKDGPSAGLTIAVALFSALTGKKVPKDIAFTGEINLSGEILPVGGLREKMLAAQRSGIRTVVVPEVNRKAALELRKKAAKGLQTVFAGGVREVLSYVFENESVGNKRNGKLRGGRRASSAR